MKGALVLVLLIIATAAAFYLAWMNRASEKIITAVIPIAIAAIVAVFLAVLVFGGEAPINQVFPSTFMYRIEGKMPVGLPRILEWRRFTDSLFAPAQLHKTHPEVFKETTDESGATLYHHLLQKSIIAWMGMRYTANWETEITDFDLPTGREQRFQPAEDATEPSKVYSTEELVQLLEGNYFAEIHPGIPPRIAVPAGTKLTIRPPRRQNGGFEIGEILLKNDFCTLSIQTQYSGWMRGIGSYRRLAGISNEENHGLATATYRITFNARFSRLRSGHPKMPKYRAWASQLAAELRKQFDEQVIWEKTKDDYLFSKQVEQ
ncbi:hypothetical protein MYX77_04555 [Acidobacteriia bacterium AH_259_A11_L15]|nr:hypothetical protein [Acidobacteriia bacterium AH_259_A11_L15]